MRRVRVLVLTASLALVGCASALAGVRPGLVASAAIPQPTHPGDIVGLVLQNLGKTATPVLPLTFGEVFKRGAVMPDAQLLFDIGKLIPLQMDPKTYHRDGSVAMATITVMAPSLPARTATGAMLVHAHARTASPAAPVDLSTALRHYRLVVDLGFQNPDGSTSRVEVNGVAALQAALRKGTASYWRRGPLATEALVNVPVRGSFRLVFDITAFANGAFSSDVRFNNDIAMQPVGGTVIYSESIVQDGKTVSRHTRITQYQYQDWHTVVGTVPSSAQVNIQHDIAYLEQTGAIPYYDLHLGVAASILRQEAAMMASPGWEAPLSPNGITEGMPGVGGRPDIGPTTQWNAAWLMTQNPIAARFALGQADAAGAVPWHFFYPETGNYLTTEDIPNIWTDPGNPSGAIVLTQPLTRSSGWTPDRAHEPDLPYLAYLLTGDQYYLDQLNAEATWSETSNWPDPSQRKDSQGLVVQREEVRAGAWSLREIVEAAYANPPGSPMERYFRRMETNNFSWLMSQIPVWTAEQGQAYGYLPGVYGSNNGAMAPWQQDFLASTMVLAAEQGNRQAVTFLKWQSNFLVGRFLNGANGFSPRDGIAYNLYVYDPHTKEAYKTWAAIEKATAAAGDSNRNGWLRNSRGYYGQLGLQTLAGIITITGSPEAVEAYHWLQHSGAWRIDPVSRATWPQFAIVPGRDPAAQPATR